MAVAISEENRSIFLEGINKLADQVIVLPATIKVVSKEEGEFSGTKYAKLSAVNMDGDPFELKVSGFGESGLDLKKLMFKDIDTTQISKSLALKVGRSGSPYVAGFNLHVQADYLKSLLNSK